MYKSKDIFRSYKIYCYFCFMKKSILYMLALCLLVGCGKSYEEQKRITKAERDRLHQEDLRALHVAVLPTLDCMPLLVEK